jgi:hypothetical protein
MSAVDSATCWGRLLAAFADSILEKMRIPVGGERWSSGVRGDRSCGRRRAPAATGRKANARHRKISAIGLSDMQDMAFGFLGPPPPVVEGLIPRRFPVSGKKQGGP